MNVVVVIHKFRLQLNNPNTASVHFRSHTANATL